MGCISSCLQKSEVSNNTEFNIQVRYKPYRTCSLTQCDSPQGYLGSCHFQYSTPEATLYIAKQQCVSICSRCVTFDIFKGNHCICKDIILRPGEIWTLDKCLIEDYIQTIHVDIKLIKEQAYLMWEKNGSVKGNSSEDDAENDRRAKRLLQFEIFKSS